MLKTQPRTDRACVSVTSAQEIQMRIVCFEHFKTRYPRHYTDIYIIFDYLEKALIMYNDHFFTVYKLFHDKPGTPKDKACVSCKVAAGGALLAVTIASAFAVKSRKSHPIRAGFGVISVLIAGSGSMICFNEALNNIKHNKKLENETKIAIKESRKRARDDVPQP